MFEALSWRKQPRTEVVHYAADSLAHAGRNPIVLGSLVAMALFGIAARIGWFDRLWFNRTLSGLNPSMFGRPRATVMPARARANAEKAMPANGRRRRRRRKRKVASNA